MAIVDDEATDDFAERFTDELPEQTEPAPTQRRALGLARALQGGALSAALLPSPPELTELKPVLNALGALATGRHAAAVALREVLRELYPAALRAYPDPADPVALAVLDALPEPGTLSSSTSGRSRDAAAAADTAAARLVADGLADQASITEAITALRVAIAETPRRGGISRALTATVAETVRQAVASVRACDAANTALVNALAQRVVAPRYGSATPAAPTRPAAAQTRAPAQPASRPRSHRAPASAPPAPAPRSPAPPPTPPQPVAPLSPAPQPVAPAPPLPARTAQRTTPPRRSAPPQPVSSAPPQPVPSTPPPVAPPPVAPPAGRRSRPSSPAGPGPGHGYPAGQPAAAPPLPPRAPASAPVANSAPANRPVSPPPPPPPGITPIAEPRPPIPAPRPPAGPGDQVRMPASRPGLTGPPSGSRADWPTRPPADDWAGPSLASRFSPAGNDRAARGTDRPLPPNGLPTDPGTGTGTGARAEQSGGPAGRSGDRGGRSALNGAPRPNTVTPPWQADDLRPPEPPDVSDPPPSLRLVEPTLPDELRGDLGYPSSRSEPPPLRLIDTNRNGIPHSAPPVSADDDDTLLIFAQTRSAWFTQDDEASWNSAMDLGWQAAEQAAQPTVGDRTGAGLPRRVPHANLVPGAPPRRDDRPLRVVRDAASIAENTSGYFNGWRRGQEVGGYPLGGRQRRPGDGAWEFHRDEDRMSG
jgi:hypothetical protein